MHGFLCQIICDKVQAPRPLRRTVGRAATCLLLLLSLLIGKPALAIDQPQFRCFWAEVFQPGFKSTAEIDTMVSYAVQGNYNVIMPEVLAYQDNNGYASHGAFWKSSIVPWAPAVTTSFDPLAYLIQQAHAQNIEVHAWIVPFRVSTAWPPAGNTRLDPDPGDPHDEYLSVLDSDINTGPQLVSGAYTLDPGSPDVQDYLLDIIRELVTNYEIDGINLDHIRYEKTNAGYPSRSWYTKSSLARFQTITGYVGTPPASGNTSWNDFRRRTITEIVRRARAEIASIDTNPRQPVRLTADLIVYGDAPALFTSSDAYGLFQNWQFWMQQGYLDGGMPMNYKNGTLLAFGYLVPQLGHKIGPVEVQPPHVYGHGRLYEQQGQQRHPDELCPQQWLRRRRELQLLFDGDQ